MVFEFMKKKKPHKVLNPDSAVDAEWLETPSIRLLL